MLLQLLAYYKWHLILGALILSLATALVWNFYQGIEDKAVMQTLQQQNEVLKQEQQLQRLKYQQQQQQLKAQIAEIYREKEVLKDENKRIKQYNENLLNTYRSFSGSLEPRPSF